MLSIELDNGLALLNVSEFLEQLQFPEGDSSWVEYTPSMHDALSFIPST